MGWEDGPSYKFDPQFSFDLLSRSVTLLAYMMVGRHYPSLGIIKTD